MNEVELNQKIIKDKFEDIVKIKDSLLKSNKKLDIIFDEVFNKENIEEIDRKSSNLISKKMENLLEKLEKIG